jgi:hypothetical protein
MCRLCEFRKRNGLQETYDPKVYGELRAKFLDNLACPCNSWFPNKQIQKEKA